ncbi:MAG: hypothetical protein Kow00105_11370 [Phycisphaeraceae bacterium]
MRVYFSCKSLLALTLVVMFVAAPTAQAQQFRGSGNSKIPTIAEMPGSKLKPRIRQSFGLNLRPLGLFRDAEVFDFGTFRPFIFPLPNLSSREEFIDISFEEYLEKVAGSYGLDVGTYLTQFQFQNEFTAQNPFFVPTFDQVIDVHRQDFAAGGGFLPLPEPTIPQPPAEEPADDFEPLEPIFTTPLTPLTGTDSSTTTADVAALAQNIVGNDVPVGDGDGADAPILPVGASQSAAPVANVTLVPEPASLGLLSMGASLLLIRRR